MEIKKILNVGFEVGYYYCEECYQIVFCDDEEDFEETQCIKCNCDKCNKTTLKYPISEHLYNFMNNYSLSQMKEFKKWHKEQIDYIQNKIGKDISEL